MAEETVLIIDDSKELRSLLEAILPLAGYQVRSAASGEEGLGLAQEPGSGSSARRDPD